MLLRMRRFAALIGRRAFCSVHQKTVFTALQPTGSLHIGNYFGAIQSLLHAQQNDNYKVILAVADLHSLTAKFWRPPSAVYTDILDLVASIVACGVDPKRVTLFQQSRVSEHCELAWIFGCLVSVHSLQRMPQYKAKSAEHADAGVPFGLLSYPVLQAADILLYRATHVPVGDDQHQHIQVAQNIQTVFNLRTKTEYFPSLNIVQSKAPRLKSLREPHKKMSKSDSQEKSRIEISDRPDQVRSKIQKALTDFESAVYFDEEERPAVSNLMTLHLISSGKSIGEIEKMAEERRLNTSQYKKILADDLLTFLQPIHEEYVRLRGDVGYLLQVLDTGADDARSIAMRTMSDVRRLVGVDLNELKHQTVDRTVAAS